MNIYLDLLKKIESSGFVAYIVGGYVRDYLLGIPVSDVDIITNATPKDLKGIFNEIKSEFLEYGSVKLYYKNNIIDITTFRKELSYKNGKPDKIEYITSLEDDLYRRDFTINTICMDSDGNIVDLLNGKVNLDNKLIKCVRNASAEFHEDPSRMLRALRFMSTLDLKLDQDIIDFMVKNKELFKSISTTKLKEELDKLFKSSKASKFFDFIEIYNLEDYIGIKCNNFIETDTILTGYAELEINVDLPFTKYEKEQIMQIRSLLSKGSIDKIDVYNFGEYICNITSPLLGIEKKHIHELYERLSIKSVNDIDITSEEVCNILNIEPSKYLGDVIKSIEAKILNGNLSNNKNDIINYLKGI